MNFVQKLLLGVVSVSATKINYESLAEEQLQAPPTYKKKLETIKKDVKVLDELFKDVSIE